MKKMLICVGWILCYWGAFNATAQEVEKTPENTVEHTAPAVNETVAKEKEEGVPAKNKANITHSKEVVVSATKIEKELQEVPVAISVITEEGVVESGAQTIGDALKDIPHVEVSDSGSQGLKRIRIRGESPTRTLVLIDGQKIVENKSMDGAPVLIDPSRVERIEVIKGPASVLYGSDAIGGVINIITKKGGTKPIQGEVHGGYSTAGNGFSEGASIYGAAKGFSYRFTVNQNDQGNLKTPVGRIPNTGFSATDASAYVDYTFLDKYTVGLAYDFFNTNIKSTIEEQSLIPNITYPFFQANIPEWQRHKVRGFFEARDVTSYLTRVRWDVFWQWNRKKFNNNMESHMPYLGLTYVSKTNTDVVNINQQVGTSVQTDWLIADEHLLIVGYDFSYDGLETDNISRSSGGIPAIPPSQHDTSRTYGAEAYTITNALYAQGESPLPKDLVLSYGVRYTLINMKLQKDYSIKNGAVDNTYFVADRSDTTRFYHHPVFNLGLTWAGVEGLVLRGIFSQGFRAPLMQETLFNSQGADVIYASAKLRPEKSHNIEFGTRYNAYNVSLDFSLFYTFAEDYITAFPTGGMTGRGEYQYRNVGKAHTIGAEITVGYLIEKIDLTPYFSAAWIKRQFDYGKKKTWNSGTPEWSGRIGLRYERDFAAEGISFYMDVYGRFYSNTVLTLPAPTGNTEPALSATQTVSVGSFITLNATSGIRFGKDRAFYLNVEAYNMTNEKYISPMAVNQIGGGYIYEPGFYMGMRVGAEF